MEQRMNILVLGAGAVGSTVGGMLARAGHSVTLLGRNPHMLRIAASGLTISGLWGDHQVKNLKALTDIPAMQPDVILLTTKAYDTDSAARLIKARFPKKIPVLHLQNGVGNAEILAEHLGEARVISGMIIIGFQVIMAGHTRVTVSADAIKIGRKDQPADAEVRLWVEMFTAAGMPAESVNDIQTQLWGKVLYNSSLNALGGILGVKYGDLLEVHAWSMIKRLIREAFAALAAGKVKIPWDSPEAYLDHLRNIQVPATFDHKPSLLSDLHHGRRTEIDFINGALVDLGKKHRISMPVNETLISMIHALEENSKKGILHPSIQTHVQP